MDVSREMEERVLNAFELQVREMVVLPTHCETCGKRIELDGRAGEMWHVDSEANRDHRPMYRSSKGHLI